MDPLELKEFSQTRNICENVCRICLQKDVILNWNDEIPEHFNLTYKECYYKYTQLDILVIDPYSQMLCEKCAVELQESHFLIMKALESHSILQRTHLRKLKIISIENEDIEYKQVKEKSNVSSEENVQTSEIMISTFDQICYESINDDIDDKEFEATSSNIETCINGKRYQKLQVKINKITSQHRNRNKKFPRNILTSKKETGKKYMCSNCSKIFSNMRSLIRHEETHNNNRERSEICTVCGIRFFDKHQLTLHIKTHNELREKKYKCEFCEKAYFNMGSLNVHRRIHLGQMIPCPLCTKEFYRKDDLNRHNITAHSSTTIHTNIKKKSKYYVYCKDCNKQLRTTTWKAHQAAHLNEPLMKCSICHKDFFTRSTVTHHMHKVHSYKTRAEYEQFIVYSKPKRLSHLLLEQQDVLKSNST